MLPTLRELHRTQNHPHAREALLERVLAEARQPAAAHVYTTLFDKPALAAARAADQRHASGEALPLLAGLPVTVKDLYDIAGRTTLAGSVLRQGAPAAPHDAEAVARLRRAGAAITGLTNMSEFAFSGVGINPHHGTPRNPADAAVARIPGGSSSGAAVSVALGQAVAALGSDTGGSIRIPAALCGLVGFKNTQSRTPLDGAFPLSFTLDTVCGSARRRPCSGRRTTGSGAPASTASTIRQSSTQRAIAHTVSSVNDSGKAPASAVRACVFLKPTRPHSAAGMRIEPPVSEPSPATAWPSATETAAPADEPPGMRATCASQGLRGVPWCGRSSRAGAAAW